MTAGLALVAAAQEPNTPPIRGFSPAAAAQQHALERRLAALISRDSTGAAFRAFTRVPHPAGTVANRRVAEEIAARFRRYGWEDVRITSYDVLLPFPDSVSVQLVRPTRYTATLREPVVAVDPDTRADAGPTYLGMSASGDVTGELIYANSGNPADYDWLESQGISVKGKIALVRYSNPYSYRGFKALTAEQRGVKAMLIYSDPQEDGYRRGLTFPDGPWGPEGHLQRGAISYDFIAPGDPLTPGWASVVGARRLAEADVPSIPKIIAVPLSARDAAPLLRSLRGPVAPAPWQGALPFTYRVGSGPGVVKVVVKMDGKRRTIHNVEARIRGTDEPDRTVYLGNHHDAWVYGAVDPSSGTATQMELARTLGLLKAQGVRPRRTLMINSWDAEEWHLTGSTEWGEEFASDLQRGAVAYLNVDGSTSGAWFGASAVASLNPIVTETVRDVMDPGTNESILATWAKREGKVPDPSSLPTNTLGSGSDYTVFLNFLGIPVVDMAFTGPYGVYHSIYDNHYWMTRHGDPGFRYMTAMVEVWGRMALRLANAEVLPHDFAAYAARVREFVRALESLDGVAANLDLAELHGAVGEWAQVATSVEAAMTRSTAPQAGPARAALNEALRAAEQAFLLDGGIPGRPYFKHALYAPRPTYAALELPGVREAIEARDWPRARVQAAALAARIRAVSARLREGIGTP